MDNMDKPKKIGLRFSGPSMVDGRILVADDGFLLAMARGANEPEFMENGQFGMLFFWDGLGKYDCKLRRGTKWTSDRAMTEFLKVSKIFGYGDLHAAAIVATIEDEFGPMMAAFGIQANSVRMVSVPLSLKENKVSTGRTDVRGKRLNKVSSKKEAVDSDEHITLAVRFAS
jgi:hypothetical protein